MLCAGSCLEQNHALELGPLLNPLQVYAGEMPAIKVDPATTLSTEDLDELLSDSDYLDSEEEDFKPSPARARMLRPNCPGKLQPPRTTTYSARHLHEMMHSGQIELSPDYQRDIVWRREKQITLIQSLFMNYPVPPVLFSCQEVSEEEGDTMTCIDGKQRLTSIRRFMDGEIPFKPIGTSQQFWFTDADSKRRGSRNLLPASYRRAFEQMQITCIEYRNLRQEQERDIFQRVQLGIALTPAEKMQAIAGPWPDFVQEILKQYVFGEGKLRDLIVSDFLRGRGYSNVVSALMICNALPENKVSPTVTQMATFMERTDSPPAALKKRFARAFEVFLDIAKNHHNEAFETVAAVKVAPVEFAFIAVLIYTLLPQYQDDIKWIVSKISQMRLQLRQSRVDVRAKGKVMNDCHALIDSISKTKEKKRPLHLIDDPDQEKETKKGKRGRKTALSERSQLDPLTSASLPETHASKSAEGKGQPVQPAAVQPDSQKEQHRYPNQPVYDQPNGVPLPPNMTYPAQQ